MIQLLWTGEYLIFVLLIIALVLSLTIHELGHAVVAKWFGDDTAERAGRITLNPIAHIDPMGLMMVIIVGFGLPNPCRRTPPISPALRPIFGLPQRVPMMNLLLAVDLLESLHAGLACFTDHTAGRDLFHPACPDQLAADDFQPTANRAPRWSLHCTAPTAAESRSGVSLLQRTLRGHGAVGPGGRSLLGLPLLSWLAQLSRTLLN